jgi:hypothetical protein
MTQRVGTMTERARAVTVWSNRTRSTVQLCRSAGLLAETGSSVRDMRASLLLFSVSILAYRSNLAMRVAA